MVASKGITVTVNVDKNPLTEYLNDEISGTESSTAVINRYIESKVGEYFTIKINCDDAFFDECKIFSSAVYIDRAPIKNPIFELGRWQSRTIVGPEGKIGGEWKVKPMIFDDIQTSKLQWSS